MKIHILDYIVGLCAVILLFVVVEYFMILYPDIAIFRYQNRLQLQATTKFLFAIVLLLFAIHFKRGAR